MEVQILGVSGSPVPGSNTDWAIKKILKHTGLDWQFVKLSDLNIHPCHACLGCVKGGHCVVRDDAHEVARLFSQAQAFVLGGYTPLGSLDARTKMFMERLACLRGEYGPSQGKVGVSVITTPRAPEGQALAPAADLASRQVDYWMADEGMVNLGTMVIEGNVANLRTVHGDDCPMNGIQMLCGPFAVGGAVHVRAGGSGERTKFDEATRELGEKLRQAVLDMGTHAAPASQREAV